MIWQVFYFPFVAPLNKKGAQTADISRRAVLLTREAAVEREARGAVAGRVVPEAAAAAIRHQRPGALWSHWRP